MTTPAKEKIIVALDLPSIREAEAALDQLAGAAVWCKIGMELFTREGPETVRLAKRRGFKVFLDLKFHDIPNTVASGVKSACALGVDMLTIHLSGGPEMVSRAVEAASPSETLVLGVTVLTSSTAETLAAIGIPKSPEDMVIHLAKLGVEQGLEGIVCSPLEIRAVREALEESLRLVTPGVRPAGAALGDQKRVMTPSEAVNAGADWLVIGRPILAASDRRVAFEAVCREIER